MKVLSVFCDFFANFDLNYTNFDQFWPFKKNFVDLTLKIISFNCFFVIFLPILIDVDLNNQNTDQFLTG